jgi:hypothetical protein
LALRKVPGVTASAGSINFNVLTVAVLTIYFLVGLPRGQAAATALLAGQRKHADRNVRILEESLGRIGRYVSGNIVISIIAGTLAFVVLEILRVPFAAALGFWVAIADLIPSVGATLGAVLCVIVALFSSVADGSSSIMTGTWTRTPRRPATRQDCDLEHLSLWAQQEGITVVGTAICQDLPTLAHWGSGCRPAPTGRGIRSRGGRTR